MPSNRFTNHLSRLGTPPAGQSSFNGGDTSKLGGGEAKFSKAQVGANIVVVKLGEDIQNAINIIRDTNGGTVFLRNGQHDVRNDLVLYSDITLEGESIYGTIIDFGAEAYSLRIEGTDAYTDGTVTITQGGTTVMGSSTVWTEEMVGQSIALDGDAYEITAVTSATELSIGTSFAGADQAGITYFIATTIDGNYVQNLTIQNSSTHLVRCRYAYVPVLTNASLQGGDRAFECIDTFYPGITGVDMLDCQTGIYFNNCYAYSLQSFYIFNCTGNGIEFIGGGDSTLMDFGVSKCNGVGIQFTDINKVSMISFTIENNLSHGIEFVSGCVDNGMVLGAIENNAGDGIKYTATSDRNIINGIQIRDNGVNGVNVANANCDSNIIISNIFSGNVSGQVSNTGTGTLIRSNIGQTDN